MGKQLQIRLDSHDLGQLLGGLRAWAKSWRKTAEFLESGYVADKSFICEECNDASEAKAIARHYEKIISLI